ncbi:MAG: hypothetical protein KGZ37_08480 [Nitrosarchaeum sp.]|nr:hypothetical protein [Nitrosarchaeum sp.]
MRARRGISPILSIIILIGISVAGGSLLYNVQSQVLITGLSATTLKITDLKMEKDSQGACYFQAKVYNSGTDFVKSIHLKTTLDSGDDYVLQFDSFGDVLVPGNSTVKELFMPPGNPNCGNFTISNVYSVKINATSVDSEFSIIKSMKVENVTKS